VAEKPGVLRHLPCVLRSNKVAKQWRSGMALLAAFAAARCGQGSGSSRMTMMATPSQTPSATMVSIVGQRGDQSFVPNPAAVPQGSVIAWRNDDTTMHRIVLNDGSFDSGNIAPGGVSPPVRLASVAGGQYHCTIHPTTMFGRVNTSSAMTPDNTGVLPYTR
jgi:plastocyanin